MELDLSPLSNGKIEDAKVIGFGYYDGITSGVIFSDTDSNTFYFDLVAWDEWQDQRLFAICNVDIDKKKIDKLIEVADLTEEKLLRGSLLFGASLLKKSERQIKEIDDSIQGTKEPFKLFALGEHIHDPTLKITEISNHLVEKVEEVSKRAELDTDHLDNWLPLLNFG